MPKYTHTEQGPGTSAGLGFPASLLWLLLPVLQRQEVHNTKQACTCWSDIRTRGPHLDRCFCVGVHLVLWTLTHVTGGRPATLQSSVPSKVQTLVAVQDVPHSASS